MAGAKASSGWPVLSNPAVMCCLFESSVGAAMGGPSYGAVIRRAHEEKQSAHRFGAHADGNTATPESSGQAERSDAARRRCLGTGRCWLSVRNGLRRPDGPAGYQLQERPTL